MKKIPEEAKLSIKNQTGRQEHPIKEISTELLVYVKLKFYKEIMNVY